MATISFEVRPSFRDVKGKFAKADDELLRDKRDMMRDLGRVGVRLLKDEAPKKSGESANKIGFRTSQQGEVIDLAFTIPPPLKPFVIEGTKPHEIAARNAGALRFFWPKIGMMVMVPKGGGFKTHERDGTLWIGKGHVNHPGTKANPFNQRAYKIFRPIAAKRLAQIAVNWRENATS